ncbi:MAG: hypothetical protein AAF242_15005, partial [Bacteroidota bacterium]
MKRTLQHLRKNYLFSLSFLLLPFLVFSPKKNQKTDLQAPSVKAWTTIESDLDNGYNPLSAESLSAAFCMIQAECKMNPTVILSGSSGTVNSAELEVAIDS